MDKQLVKLVERLNDIFPNLEMGEKGYYMYEGDYESDFTPPVELDWFDIIKELKENGLEIKK